jgi:hypothetical protein
MIQKVVTIRMSVSNNTVIGHIERDFIEHTDLNKLLENGWKIADTIQASSSSVKDVGYTAITFILEKEPPVSA